MLRVTFDIVPGGDEKRSRTIGVMELANIDTRLDGTADYAVVMKKTPPFKGALRDAWRKGRVTDTDGIVSGVLAGDDDEAIVAFASGHHRSKRGVYDLLFRAMKACGMDGRQ